MTLMRYFTMLHLWVYSLWSALSLYLAYFLVHQIWEILDMTLGMKSQLLNLHPQQVKFYISLHLLLNLVSSLIFNAFQMITSQPLKFLIQVLFAKVRINTLTNIRLIYIQNCQSFQLKQEERKAGFQMIHVTM